MHYKWFNILRYCMLTIHFTFISLGNFLKSDEVEDIIFQVSIFVIFADVASNGNENVPIREESLNSPTPMLLREGGGP